MKLWLCGMIRGNREILEQTVAPYMEYFDGCIFVVDDRAKLTDVAWLQNICKAGKIFVKKWVNDHAHTSNEVLLTEIMEYPDYFVWIDETDKLNLEFAKRLRTSCEGMHTKNIGAAWLDHPFILRYHRGLRFFGSPHWSVHNIIGQVGNLTSAVGYKKENYIDNLRKNDILRSGFLSPIKYWFCYPPFSNHTELLYRQFSDEIWKRHELLRIEFQFYCQESLHLNPTMEAWQDYLVNNVNNYPSEVEKILELEVNAKDAFRLFVLKQPWIELSQNRFDWSYFHWKKTGEIIQDRAKTGYRGIFNEYKIRKGEQPE